MIITPVLVTRGFTLMRGFTSRKNTIIHCFHGSYSSRGLLFRYPITIEDYPRQGVGAARSAARTRPLNGTPTSILWNGDDDRRETSPYQTSSCSALAGTKEQGEAPSGARVAKLTATQGDSRSVYLVARANQAHYGQLPRPHKCGRPTVR